MNTQNTPWTIERSSKGFKGISIKDAAGRYIANIVMQMDDSELAIAKHIVACVNAKAQP